jgi:hypothetical protein
MISFTRRRFGQNKDIPNSVEPGNSSSAGVGSSDIVGLYAGWSVKNVLLCETAEPTDVVPEIARWRSIAWAAVARVEVRVLVSLCRWTCTADSGRIWPSHADGGGLRLVAWYRKRWGQPE